MMIIDCHGHYTIAPEPHQQFRNAQLAWLDDPSSPKPVPTMISDDQIRETIEPNQLRLQQERGIDMALFSPRASAMAHHLGDGPAALAWAPPATMQTESLRGQAFLRTESRRGQTFLRTESLRGQAFLRRRHDKK